MSDRKHVHFMGICGSGCASIAYLAKKAGYRVSGCDQNTESYYADKLKKMGIHIEKGHDASHLDDDVDIVAVSPAIFDVSPDNPELLLAKEKGILMTWQEFMGKCLQKDKHVIAVTGTHGKTTSTFLLAELLVDAGLDPTVEGGSLYRKWGIGARSGKSDLFVCEADEFNWNFLNYAPETVVMTIVEMDHPECFHSYDEMIDAYVQFLVGGGKLKTLIANPESPGVLDVIRKAEGELKKQGVRLIWFSHEDTCLPEEITLPYEQVTFRALGKNEEGSCYVYDFNGQELQCFMHQKGEYNIQNASGVITAALLYGAAPEKVLSALADFSGVGRRFDYVGDFLGVPVYDDYAHHPTEIRAVLTMCREYFPGKKIFAVFEPHQISRLTLMFDGYVNALTIADQVVIWRTHIGREALKGLSPIPKERWMGASERIAYEEDENRIIEMARDFVKNDPESLIIVFGAANSYKISRAMAEESACEKESVGTV